MKNNLLIALVVILIFIISLPVITRYHNLIIPSNNKIDEYIDSDTGVIYLRSGTFLTPKLDKNGKVITKK